METAVSRTSYVDEVSRVSRSARIVRLNVLFPHRRTGRQRRRSPRSCMVWTSVPHRRRTKRARRGKNSPRLECVRYRSAAGCSTPQKRFARSGRSASSQVRLVRAMARAFSSPHGPGIKLLGFKRRKDLAFEDNIKHSTFIYPDEMVSLPPLRSGCPFGPALIVALTVPAFLKNLSRMAMAPSQTYSGSRRTFTALMRTMIKRKKIAIALVLTRRNSSPIFCAVLPQVSPSRSNLSPM